MKRSRKEYKPPTIISRLASAVVTQSLRSTSVELIPQTKKDLQKNSVIRFRIGTAH